MVLIVIFFKKIPNKTIHNPLRLGFVSSKKWSEHKGIHRFKKICEELKGIVVDKSLVIDTKNTNEILSQTDMLNYYNNIDVLIISSISETGPNPLLEAMSCGVPVISNKVGLAPTIIKNNVNGILIDDMENIESYKNNIIELINNKEKYYMLSEKF